MTKNGRLLSSDYLTALYALVLPMVWIAMTGFEVLGPWRGLLPRFQADGWIIGTWLVITAILVRLCTRIKRVSLGDGKLYISNYLRQITVSCDLIERATENCWLSINPVTIHLRQATEFGDRIVFLPKVRWFNVNTHPVVNEPE